MQPHPRTAEADATLEAIEATAADGDLDALAQIALSFEPTFTASFVRDSTTLPTWRRSGQRPGIRPFP